MIFNNKSSEILGLNYDTLFNREIYEFINDYVNDLLNVKIFFYGVSKIEVVLVYSLRVVSSFKCF